MEDWNNLFTPQRLIKLNQHIVPPFGKPKVESNCYVNVTTNNLGSDFGGGELPAAFGAVVGTSGRSLRRCSRVAGNGKESAAEGGRVGTIEFYYGGCIMRLCTLD
ncbi:hypothetical protein D0Y65_020320 [Glycine soja]|uniref:Uncharacterized protein n=1 Tax=Glycine soja TaxID=3848 RepID=A0A445JDH2_GLYSO|nr:hypothetical protein D0Y65_020320 [Glycine soja]